MIEYPKKIKSCADKMHYNYISFIEGVACYLMWASQCDNGKKTVSIGKPELKKLALTLFETKTYGDLNGLDRRICR